MIGNAASPRSKTCGQKPRLLFYCQHLLGMGHFTRSIEIVKGLSAFDVTFLNGGDTIPDFVLPEGVEFIDLPPIRSDADFRRIEATGGKLDLRQVRNARRARILEACERVQPEVAVIELFPFGRRKFASELLPMLEELRRHGTRIVCSLRDIVVGKDDQGRFEEETCHLVNQYFDLVLVHADPRVQRLEETFASTASLACPVRYTGFVAQLVPKRGHCERTKPRIIVSIGGGRVGCELLECAIRASCALESSFPHRMLAFSGPFTPQDQWDRAVGAAAAAPSVTLERYSPRFLDQLADSDLSISMAGYNTSMNVMAAGVRALVYPFTGGDNEEQTQRARKLERLGVLRVIRDSDLSPIKMAAQIVSSLTAPAPERVALDMDGVARSAQLLTFCLREVAA